jgi:divalent metal cation (Fe/Co/Zn/Cd) transporter
MKFASEALLKAGLQVEYASLVWMTIEGVVAIYSGLAAWSLALLAFGGDSIIELLSSVAVVSYLRGMSHPPQSDEHADGDRTAWITAMLLISLLPAIGCGILYSIVTGIKPEASSLGIGVACGAVAVMPLLWYQKRRIGKAWNCLPLIIDAAESATCFLMSLALLIGLVANYFLKLPWIDYLMTLVILAFVAREAADSIRELSANRDPCISTNVGANATSVERIYGT